MKRNLLIMIILSISLSACSTNELQNVEKVEASFWIGNEKQSEEVAFKEKEEVDVFVGATNNAKELDDQKVIKTPPVLTYNLIIEGSNNKAFQLWITEDGEGFIQSLLPEDSLTYRLDEGSVKDVTNILNQQDNVTLLPNIEFEK
ncbi:hypothetical protein IQ283_04220 [Alkalihalobacillus hwajinpoensis]|uniref:hypothetical protein n=1 Tax=Guptibacillus hwajinpoensis TaxID=208199 RepID=UPI00188468A3|nr:hypothetical protein [Pseudalkalibacillus hwajinpoensis]MBF0705802.1 hypothetical protein [Pseudalkalibacillus hwajinpoensis]